MRTDFWEIEVDVWGIVKICIYNIAFLPSIDDDDSWVDMEVVFVGKNDIDIHDRFSVRPIREPCALEILPYSTRREAGVVKTSRLYALSSRRKNIWTLIVSAQLTLTLLVDCGDETDRPLWRWILTRACNCQNQVSVHIVEYLPAIYHRERQIRRIFKSIYICHELLTRTTEGNIR